MAQRSRVGDDFFCNNDDFLHNVGAAHSRRRAVSACGIRRVQAPGAHASLAARHQAGRPLQPRVGRKKDLDIYFDMARQGRGCSGMPPLIEVNTSSACDVACSAAYRELATLPRACLGDGLALDASHFYRANEGSFVPLRGLVFRIDRHDRKDLSSASHSSREPEYILLWTHCTPSL